MGRALGEFEQLLMFALLELGDEAYGVPIRQAIEHRTGREVSPGAVHTALDRLEGRGLVSSELEEKPPADGGRRRRYYRLEQDGARELRESFRRLTDMADGLLPSLEALAAPRGEG